ncbi:putative oxygen-independent coproporphyrinogen III oxidase [Chthonomonas calidirosea]|uniref:Heme chaperone HemW n=1 Tax=Chthonomonas calidirosea (strain DSM 23976 / ICMP 18418 / T49) TaxID=1303518 RepID=S0EZI4_CHTCT|nr:radical SAM family heme chaperone HemW [Chthonomonas calidirosea]CCW36299.1 putative oxygen-independent coproporphyrinogen III oxidase [Chthonomonas calidirosea T49]CEK17743.1 putative oxygen-independent coproporphyrinogen III oxidase [Chthonomonas calidirosea]
MIKPLSLYVHIPFCVHHCAYCDFNTYVEPAQSVLVKETVEAIGLDIAKASQERVAGQVLSERPLATVYFGGGTPTFLSIEQLTEIMAAIRSHFHLLPDAEISSEANPTSADVAKFAAMRALGFNRLSIGVQAFDNGLLTALDRFHTTTEAVHAYQAARAAGFTNVNLDLMFGLPNQTLPLWKASLEQAIQLAPEHLSLYALTIEPGTRFERLHVGGRLVLPDDETVVTMYEYAQQRLTQAGYIHYEISNFSLPGFACRHNLVYWHNEEYLGVGPGAVSYLGGWRWKRERLPKRYVQKVKNGENLCVEEECLAPPEALDETLLLGLRLRAGVSLHALRDRFGLDPLERYKRGIEKLVQQGLLEQHGDILRVSDRALPITDTVIVELLASAEA